jgi:hypothetical protein
MSPAGRWRRRPAQRVDNWKSLVYTTLSFLKHSLEAADAMDWHEQIQYKLGQGHPSAGTCERFTTAIAR